MPSYRMALLAQQGDPVPLLGLAARLIRPVATRALGAVKRLRGRAATPPLLPGRTTFGLPQFPAIVRQQLPRVTRIGKTAGALVAAGAAYEVGGRLISTLTGQPISPGRRRINPLNVKALRRSVSRLAQFSKVSARVSKQLAKLAPPRRRAPGGKKCR